MIRADRRHTAEVTEVRDVPAEGRFVVEVDGAVAQLVYDAAPGRLVLIHTEVPDEIGGHGIAGDLVRAAVDRAHAGGETIVPLCPYARRWLREHPDVAGTVEIDWKASA